MTTVDGEVSGDVRIGILGTTARWLLPRLLTATRRAPSRTCGAIVAEGSTSALIPSLLAGRFSAAIIHLPVDDPELVIEPLFAEDLRRRRPLRPPAGERGRAAAGRARRPPAAAAAARLGAAPGARPGGRLGRRATRAPRPRSTACGCSPAWPSTATAPRSSRRRPCSPYATGRFAVVRVPELPPRVVALAYQRRPAPGAPTRALFDVLRDMISAGDSSRASGSAPPPSRSARAV